MTDVPIPYYPPKKHRTHEACGAGAVFFALVLAARLDGPVIWVREAWQAAQLTPSGFHPILDPAHLLIASARDQTDALAVTEEALRSGAVSLVVTELSKPLDLTAGRRLQLAARDGKATALALIPDGMGSNAAETRWSCAPVFDPQDSTRQRWELIKNKSGTLGVWDVRWDHSARRIAVVPPVGQRPGSAGAPG
ncbi:ImuA family protein [Ruegeria hyattellae]|uniref:ImuA family protein n=1 Tax=Ruegeria hyattellae TaxID=3233337 RepID=UPI00355AD60D